MINFDSLCLKAFIEEYGNILESGRIQKIQQPSRRELVLNFRSFGQNHKLYINIDPKYPHLCITKNNLRPLEIPKQPPMFCMLLRKYLEGAKILQVKQPEHERIFEIFIESYNELGEKSPQVLAIELMGKHSNVILYNCENDIIIGCAHNVGEEKSKDRELSGGLRYIYPTKKDKKNILKTPWEEFYSDFRGEIQPEVLNNKYFDITIPLAKELIKASNNDPKILYELAKKAVDLEILNPSISFDGELFSLFSLKKQIPLKQYISTNDMIDDYFGKFVAQDKLQGAKAPLLQVVNKEIKKQTKTALTHQKTLDNSQKSEKYRVWADILTSNMHSIKDVQKNLTLENYYDNNNPITIELDEMLSLKDNIKRYYKLYNKTKTANEYANKLLESTKLEIDYLESIKNALEQAESVKITEEIKQELTQKGLIKETSKTKPQKEKMELDSIEIEGYKIFIGKNNKQNDYIISKLSSPNDLWLHTFNIPGAHILIKMPKDIETPPDNVLRKASKLAVYYSPARNSVKVDVTCTKRKYLKKPPCANPGYVTFSNETNIIVDTNEQEN
ncbi:MAG: NFACT RNA binding domain-containing protein [Candidatus Gastranaerophilales bacterium]|nr:NFACT RNA binding domain-containing protein [Candidatus Gastranaerophilales bacterium]